MASWAKYRNLNWKIIEIASPALNMWEGQNSRARVKEMWLQKYSHKCVLQIPEYSHENPPTLEEKNYLRKCSCFEETLFKYSEDI